MKILITISFLFCLLLSKPTFAQKTYWLSDTAFTNKKGILETSIFQPFKYSINNSLEFSTRPLFDFIRPEISLKKHWKINNFFSIAFKYSLSYDTLMLKIISKKGTGGLIPNDSQIPFMISGKLTTIGTFKITNLFISFIFENVHSPSIGEKNIVSVDFPILYSRFTSFVSGYSFRFGIDFSGKLKHNLEYLVDLDIYFLPDYETTFSFEHKGAILWKFGTKKQKAILAGYKFVYGEYPFGYRRDIFPFVDFMWKVSF